MTTKMTERDWQIALDIFRACLPRRGEKGHNDRLFLEALHYFSVHNVSWRALPERFGNWNSVWKRYWPLSQSSIFELFFETLASLSKTADLVQMFDSTRMYLQPEQKGARTPSARPLARRLLDQDPFED